tara:strand:- start:8 stop:574 length:567 start_codon:yes stop_codon:yes gene_type:complete
MENGLALNIQHEEFILEYLFGNAKGNGARSYANVYNNGELVPSCYSASSKLLRREDVKSYLAVKMEEQKELAQYRKIHNTEVLSNIIDEMATTDGGVDINGNPQSTHLQRNIAIAAIREQNKMLGLNEEKVDINIDGGLNFVFNYIEPSDEDDEETKREMEAIRRKHGDIDAEDISFVELKEDDIDEF